MITRAVLTVLSVLGLSLPLVAQEPNPGEHGNGQTITQEDLLGTGEIDVVPALALYQPDSFSRSGNSVLVYGFPTLTLLDGRRFSISGAMGRLANDLLPVAFLSAVDVYKIHSSPMYGTDAPGGVLDMRLNRNFAGGEFGLFYGKSSGKFGYEQKSAYIIGTVGNDKVQITAGAAYEEARGNTPNLRH